MMEDLLPQMLLDMKKKSLEQFQIKYTGWYFMGSPTHTEEKDISFQTANISPEEFAQLVRQHRVIELDSPLQDEELSHITSCFVYAIVRKQGSVFSDWISIGRARNNDIVLRFPTISKLHARLEIETTAFGAPLGFTLVENQSTGRTVHNGVLMKPDERVPVSLGDAILFGNIHCAVMDAEMLWNMLR